MIQHLHAVLYTGIALVLLTGGGNWACRWLFRLTGLSDAMAKSGDPAHPAGWIIGPLERLILAIGIVAHSWEIMAAVVALKTVARFKDLDDKSFAEYFLVGSLFSILWALLVTVGWLAYDHAIGIDLAALTGRLLDVAPVTKGVAKG